MGDPLTLALAASPGAGPGAMGPLLSEPWVEPADLVGCTANESVDLTSVCMVASELLFLLSGSRYGVRTETTRPVVGDRGCGWQGYSHLSRLDWLVLKSPVRYIEQVKIDGIVLDTADYVIYDDRRLVRVAAEAGYPVGWPVNQRIDLPDTEQYTFSVTYSWGANVPEAGKVAARVLACQLAKYILRDPDCALPDRVISVTRQGVTQTLLDPSQFLANGRTGLYLVDVWLASVTPHGQRRRASFSSPDDPRLMRPATYPTP